MSLAPSYKTEIHVYGRGATLYFECHFFNVAAAPGCRRTALGRYGPLIFQWRRSQGWEPLAVFARWTSQEGAGRPLTKGTGNPLSDPLAPLVFPRNFNRISGPDTNSCAGRHNLPDIGALRFRLGSKDFGYWK